MHLVIISVSVYSGILAQVPVPNEMSESHLKNLIENVYGSFFFVLAF